jgi:hypothetical protein
MKRSAQEILEEARRLPAAEFNWLIGEMLRHGDSSADEEHSAAEVEAAWGDEIKRRLDEIDSGAVKMIPLEEVLADMDAHIEAKRQASAKDEAA